MDSIKKLPGWVWAVVIGGSLLVGYFTLRGSGSSGQQSAPAAAGTGTDQSSQQPLTLNLGDLLNQLGSNGSSLTGLSVGVIRAKTGTDTKNGVAVRQSPDASGVEAYELAYGANVLILGQQVNGTGNSDQWWPVIGGYLASGDVGNVQPVTDVSQLFSLLSGLGPTFTPPPAPIYYIVKKHDTLAALAAKYHTTVKQLETWNCPAYPYICSSGNDFLQIGWMLRVG